VKIINMLKRITRIVEQYNDIFNTRYTNCTELEVNHEWIEKKLTLRIHTKYLRLPSKKKLHFIRELFKADYVGFVGKEYTDDGPAFFYIEWGLTSQTSKELQDSMDDIYPIKKVSEDGMAT